MTDTPRSTGKASSSRLLVGRRTLGGSPALQASIALVAILILATLTSPLAADGSRIFLQAGNLTDILRQVSVIGIIALGMTFVILTGGIDLSVGSLLALSSALTAAALVRFWSGVSPTPRILSAVVLGIVACGVAGVVNGCVVARLRVQPFIATLASMIGVRGLAKWLTGNENIDIGFGQDVAAQFASIFRGKGVVIGSYLVLAAASWIVLARSVFGRYVRAIGDNPTAAVYAGLPIARTQVTVYALSGLLAGVAGILYAAENHQGNPNAGIAYELDAIAAVVIGGTPLSGGRGTIAGTIVGTLIMGVLTNLLRLSNVDSNVEMMIKAVIIVLAVSIQRGRSR
jgi:ribose/xylose/arabinose/galactoside ABC-type transport system permease subunit